MYPIIGFSGFTLPSEISAIPTKSSSSSSFVDDGLLLIEKSTQTKFIAEVLVNGDVSDLKNTISHLTSIDVRGTIIFDPNDINQIVHLAVIVQYNNHFFMKTSEGWSSWDSLKLEDIVPYKSILTNDIFEMDIVNGLEGLSGSFKIYYGYVNKDHDIVYTSMPINLVVE